MLAYQPRFPYRGAEKFFKPSFRSPSVKSLFGLSTLGFCFRDILIVIFIFFNRGYKLP